MHIWGFYSLGIETQTFPKTCSLCIDRSSLLEFAILGVGIRSIQDLCRLGLERRSVWNFCSLGSKYTNFIRVL